MKRLSFCFCIVISPVVLSLKQNDESVRYGFPRQRSTDTRRQSDREISIERTQSLGGGRYVTTTDVRQILGLGNDLLAIDSTNDFEEIERIYRNGNTGILNQTEATGLLSLASLSLEGSRVMMNDPEFIIFRNTFSEKGRQKGEEQGYFRSRRAEYYADTIVSDTISRTIVGIQSEAILVLIVWMAMTHELNSVWRNCAMEYNPDGSLVALDRAAAYWIGVEDGISSGGYLMYRLAENSADYFNESTDEALVNTHLIDGLSSVQNSITSGNVCSEGRNPSDLRRTIDRIKALTIVPLLQNLIHYVMMGEEPALARIYLAAVIPHIAACDENLVNILNVDKITSLNGTEKISWVESLQNAFSCMKVSCDDLGNYTQFSNYPQCRGSLVANFAGYIATSPESELYSRLDRDLQRLKIFLSEEALGPALDLYKQGYHAPFSLQTMALNKVIPQGDDPSTALDTYTMGNSSQDASTIANQEILSALQHEDIFRNLTSKQLSQVVLGLLSYHASFFTINSALTLSKEKCNNEGNSSLNYWDIAAALYIGSTNTAGDRGNKRGPLLYGASTTLCSMFDTCSNGNSLVNNKIIEAFSTGKELISKGYCVALNDLIDKSAIPALRTTVIQGILASVATFTISHDVRSTNPGLVHAFARTLLPLLREASPENDDGAELQLLLPDALTLSRSSVYDLAQVLYTALPRLDVDCKAVGTLETLNLTLCQDIRLQIPINKMTLGRYLFSDTDLASQIAAIALDVRDIENATSIEQAQKIYRQGRHSVTSQGEKVTLSYFSVEATRWMGDNPIFNLYKYALYNESTLELQNATFPYADELILKTKNKQLLSEASVVLNVWMMISHHLWRVWRTCSAHQNTSRDLDSAVALWIGEGQQEGSLAKGWLFYAVTQDAAQRFGQREQEAVLNTKLMQAFRMLQEIAKSCPERSQNLHDVWDKIVEVQRLLTIPLVQMLLSAIAENDKAREAIYYMSVIPQSVGCNTKLYGNLSGWLLTTDDYQGLNNEAIDDLALFLECLDIDCDDLNVTTSATQTLQNVVGRLCVAQEGIRTKAPSTDPIFRAASRINLDVRQIEILLRNRANQAAQDLYLYGRNVNVSGLDWRGESAQSSLFSLHDLATLDGNSSIIEDFAEYYGSPRHADDLVMEAIQQQGLYSNASSNRIALDNSAIVQTFVFFQGILWYLDAAVRKCQDGQLVVARKAMLLAMGVFHGFPSGFSFRALGDKLCADFGTCTVSGESTSNQAFLKLLQDGSLSLGTPQNCQDVKDMIETDAIPLLIIPLIQGSLERAVFRGTSRNNAVDEAHASGFSVTQVILPLLANTYPESAKLLQSIFGSPQDFITSSEETEAVFEAVQYALPGMKVNCTYMGTWIVDPLLSFCYDFKKSYDMLPFSNFGKDVNEMQSALRNSAIELARTIYTSGKNVVLNDTVFSLQSLYLDAAPAMAAEPIYQLYKISYGGDPLYADDIVQGAFNHAGSTKSGVARSLQSTSPIAAEAVVVLILWQAVLHDINQGLQAFEGTNGSPKELSEAINRARAYWIGDAQPGDTESGHLLYGWANEMSTHFESFDESDNIPGVNDYILTMFADTHPVIWSVSLSNSTKVLQLYEIFNRMINQMTIPLVQGLVHAMSIKDSERVKLYAQAVLPLVASCDRTEEQQLVEDQLINGTFAMTELDGMIDHVYEILVPCLRLTCRQVGVPKSEEGTGFGERSLCKNEHNNQANKSYHGYQPSRSEVFEDFVRMDQDLREIKVLLDANAFQAGEQVYKYGHYGTNSLKHLALGARMSWNDTAVFAAFSSYYSNDFYSDILVSNAIHDGLYRQGSNTIELSDEERQILVVGFVQMVVLPHAALGSIKNAGSACQHPAAKSNVGDGGNDHDDAMNAWDRAAALLLGSGRLSPFDLGQTYCTSFGTCDAKTGVAESNRMMLDLLYAGRGALTQENCDVLIKVSNEIEALVLVPIIQSTLKTAFDAARERTSQTMAHAFVSSRAILPLIQEFDESIAARLAELVPLRSQQSHVPRNAGATVMDLLSQVYEELNIDCDWIGRLGVYNPCESNNSNLYASSEKQGLSVGGLVAIILSLVIGMVVAFFWWRKKRERKQRSTMMVESKPTLETLPDRVDGYERPSPSSLSSHSRTIFRTGSKVGKGGSRHSESTMDTVDLHMITNSFQSSTPRLSSKADRTLNRIMSYGDDDESAAIDEDWVLQRKLSQKETGSLTGLVIAKGTFDDDVL